MSQIIPVDADRIGHVESDQVLECDLYWLREFNVSALAQTGGDDLGVQEE